MAQGERGASKHMVLSAIVVCDWPKVGILVGVICSGLLCCVTFEENFFTVTINYENHLGAH